MQFAVGTVYEINNIQFHSILPERNLGKTALHTGGLRFGTHCLMTVEKLIPFQLLKRS